MFVRLLVVVVVRVFGRKEELRSKPLHAHAEQEQDTAIFVTHTREKGQRKQNETEAPAKKRMMFGC